MKVKGGRKLARSSKDKNYYEGQKMRTVRNKARRAKKRADRKAFWVSLVHKKNGKPVRQ